MMTITIQSIRTDVFVTFSDTPFAKPLSQRPGSQPFCSGMVGGESIYDGDESHDSSHCIIIIGLSHINPT